MADHPLPDGETFQRAMRRAGVSADAAVVVHDSGLASAAARAWWLLRYFGHPAVAVLDGGWSAWVQAGLPQERGAERTVSPGDFTLVRAGCR